MAVPQRIRFAPLPDPRRSVIVTDDGEEHPLPEDCEEKVEPASIPAHFSLAIIGLTSRKAETTATSEELTAMNTTAIPTSATTIGKKKTSFFSLFKPFFHHHHHSSPTEHSSDDSISGSSSATSSCTSATSSAVSTHSYMRPQSDSPKSETPSTPTPTPKSKASFYGPSPSKDLHLNFGSGLFRTSSRESPVPKPRSGSTPPSSYGLGSALGRWASSGSTRTKERELGFGVPLYRTQSTQSYKRSKQLAKEARASGLLSSLHSSRETREDGMKMLNGRIYGAKRNGKGLAQKNHFDNIKSDDGNDFVEWGYGGMGSVKHQRNGVGGTVWGRLAAEGGTWGNENEDEDDGSGMTWVKQRQERREREAREKASAEDKAEDPPTPVATSKATQPQSPSQTQREPSRMPSSSPSHAPSSDKEAEHVRVMNVPAPTPRQHHAHIRKVSQVSTPPDVTSSQAGESDEMTSRTKDSAKPSPTPSEFDSSDNDDDPSPTDTEEEEEEDETATRERLSKLSMGAGVEKVSSHHRHR